MHYLFNRIAIGCLLFSLDDRSSLKSNFNEFVHKFFLGQLVLCRCYLCEKDGAAASPSVLRDVHPVKRLYTIKQVVAQFVSSDGFFIQKDDWNHNIFLFEKDRYQSEILLYKFDANHITLHICSDSIKKDPG